MPFSLLKIDYKWNLISIYLKFVVAVMVPFLEPAFIHRWNLWKNYGYYFSDNWVITQLRTTVVLLQWPNQIFLEPKKMIGLKMIMWNIGMSTLSSISSTIIHLKYFITVFVWTKILRLGRIEGAEGVPSYHEYRKILSSFIGCQDNVSNLWRDIREYLINSSGYKKWYWKIWPRLVQSDLLFDVFSKQLIRL